MRATRRTEFLAPAPTLKELHEFRRLFQAAYPEASAEPTPTEDEALTDDELVALAGHLIDFAINEWEGGRRGRGSTVPCIAANVAFQTKRSGGHPVAATLAERMKSDPRVEERMRAFLSEVGQPPDEWRARLDGLARDGNYTAAFGSKGQNRISRSDCDNEFVPAFERYLQGLPSLSKKQVRRYLVVLPTLTAVFLGGCTPASGLLGTIVAKITALLVANTKIIIAIIALLVSALGAWHWCSGDSRPLKPVLTVQADDARGLDTDAGDRVGHVDASTEHSEGDPCWDFSHEYLIRKCLLDRAAAARFSEPSKAIADYDAALGIGRWTDESIPELSKRGPHAYTIQQIQAYEQLAALHYRQQRLVLARDNYRKALQLKNDLARAKAADDSSFMMTRSDCYLMIALERRMGSFAAAEDARRACYSDGPITADVPLHYEWGLIQNGMRQYEQAAYELAAFAIAGNGSRDTDYHQKIDAEFDREWPELRAIDKTAGASALEEAMDDLVAQGKAARNGDVTAWITDRQWQWDPAKKVSPGLLNPYFLIVAPNDGANRFGRPCELSINVNGKPDLIHNGKHLGFPVVIGLKDVAAGKRYVVRATTTARDGCSPRTVETQFCVAAREDGFVPALGACQAP